MRSDSLKHKVLRAAIWTVGAHLAAQVVRFGGNLVMTRLLAPDAFGVMSIGLVIVFAIMMLSDIGLQQVIIRSPRGDSPELLNTVWTFQVCHGAVVSLVLLAMAWAVSVAGSSGLFPPNSSYARPELPSVISGLGIVCLVQGFGSTNTMGAYRNLQVGRVLMIELLGQVVGLVAMLAWAWMDRSAYALVFGSVAAAFSRVIASHLFLSGPPHRFRFSPEATREILSFGRWIFLTSAAAFVLSNGDKLLLSWFLTAEEMGVYSVAWLLIAALHELVARISSRVAFPALSADYQRNQGNIKTSYYKVRLPIDVFCLVASGALLASGEEIVTLLYDHRYANAGLYLQILAVSLIGVRFGVLTQVYCVIGRTRLMLFEQLARLLVLIPGGWLGMHFYGTVGAVWAIALSYLAAPIVNGFFLQPRLNLISLRRELGALPLLAGGWVVGTLFHWMTTALVQT